MLKKEKIVLRSVGVQAVIDFDEKREWPRFETSVKGFDSNEYYKCDNSHCLVAIVDGASVS